MSRLKGEALSIRTSAEIKQLLRMAADHERRSVASMVEVLVLEYARIHDLRPRVDFRRSSRSEIESKDQP